MQRSLMMKHNCNELTLIFIYKKKKIKENKKWKNHTTTKLVSESSKKNLNISNNTNKIRLEKLDPMGNVVKTIELNGRWKITTGEKIYFMTL